MIGDSWCSPRHGVWNSRTITTGMLLAKAQAQWHNGLSVQGTPL